MLLGGTAMNLRESQQMQKKEYVLVISEEKRTGEASILVQTENGIKSMELEEYLLGVVLTELPASFEPEAMKAQAVAARTFAVRTQKHTDFDLCTNSACCQAWRSREELQTVLGGAYADAVDKAMTAIRETKDEVLYYGDSLIEAVYFSCSGGMSEPAVAVWGSDVPYLQAVDSPGEENASKFYSEKRIPFGEFRNTLMEADANVIFSVIPQDWLGTVTHSAGGGVATMELCGVKFTGTQLRKIFQLPSTKFTLNVEGGEMVFRINGYGHRVGMSQYGANAMALDGADYKEILQHYYTGVTIKKLSRR